MERDGKCVNSICERFYLRIRAISCSLGTECNTPSVVLDAINYVIEQES